MLPGHLGHGMNVRLILRLPVCSNQVASKAEMHMTTSMKPWPQRDAEFAAWLVSHWSRATQLCTCQSRWPIMCQEQVGAVPTPQQCVWRLYNCCWRPSGVRSSGPGFQGFCHVVYEIFEAEDRHLAFTIARAPTAFASQAAVSVASAAGTGTTAVATPKASCCFHELSVTLLEGLMRKPSSSYARPQQQLQVMLFKWQVPNRLAPWPNVRIWWQTGKLWPLDV